MILSDCLWKPVTPEFGAAGFLFAEKNIQVCTTEKQNSYIIYLI